jgi:hypothetical protein
MIPKKIDSIYNSNKLFTNSKMDRYEQEQIDNERESFAIRSSLILMDLARMLEKVKKLEVQIMQFQGNTVDDSEGNAVGDPQVSKEDFFKPDEEALTALPPKKKMRF